MLLEGILWGLREKIKKQQKLGLYLHHVNINAISAYYQLDESHKQKPPVVNHNKTGQSVHSILLLTAAGENVREIHLRCPQACWWWIYKCPADEGSRGCIENWLRSVAGG